MRTITLDKSTFDMPDKFGAIHIQRYESNRDSEYDNWCVTYPLLSSKLSEQAKSDFDAEYLPKKKELEDECDKLEADMKAFEVGTPEYIAAENAARACGDKLKDYEDTYIENPSAMGLWYQKYGAPYISWAVISAICTPQLRTKRSLRECFDAATGEEVLVPVNFFLATWQGKKSEQAK